MRNTCATLAPTKGEGRRTKSSRGGPVEHPETLDHFPLFASRERGADAPRQERGDAHDGGYRRQGEITLRAAVLGDMIEITVADTGIGIAPEQQALAFEEFRQLDSTLARQHQGSGLGLPISKRFVEMHGGRMWLESCPGRGSTFAFTLPLTPAPGDAASYEIRLHT